MGAFDAELYAIGYRFPSKAKKTKPPKPYPELHLAKQPCPGCCDETVCLDTWCRAHPKYKEKKMKLEQIVELAKSCGAVQTFTGSISIDTDELAAFARAIRNQALKDAATLAGKTLEQFDGHQWIPATGSHIEDAILAMAEEEK